MKQTLYIHFGPSKSGTTAIQTFLSSNDVLLADKGFRYLKTLRCKYGSHNPLIWILYHKYFKMHLNLESIPFVKQKNDLLADLTNEINSCEHSIIISSEIIQLLSDDAIDDLFSLLPDISIKAIWYVRDLRDVSISVASQVVKFQNCRTNDERLSYIYDNHIQHFYKCYLRSLEYLDRKIGKSNIIFRKYGTGYFKDGNIFSDFLEAIGIKLTGDFVLPDKLQNESLIYNESVHFKDLLNRLPLKTPQDLLIDQLLAWEKSNAGTRFHLSKDIAVKIEKEAERVHAHLLTNFLDASYEEFFNGIVTSTNASEYKLSYAQLICMLDFMESHIAGFKDEFMEALVKTLDVTYKYQLKLREFEEIYTYIVRGNKTVALWGCDYIAKQLFMKYEFLTDKSLYIIDKDIDKQGKYFMGYEILHPSVIYEKNIDTIIITSIRYADEIINEIKERYPEVKSIIKMSDISIKGGIEHIDLMADR